MPVSDDITGMTAQDKLMSVGCCCNRVRADCSLNYRCSPATSLSSLHCSSACVASHSRQLCLHRCSFSSVFSNHVFVYMYRVPLKDITLRKNSMAKKSEIGPRNFGYFFQVRKSHCSIVAYADFQWYKNYKIDQLGHTLEL